MEGKYATLHSPGVTEHNAANVCGLHVSTDHQFQAAHLYAATVALEMLQGSKLLAGRNTIILQVDASYTSVFLSELVWIWDQRGYKNHAGKQLSFTEVAQDLHGVCLILLEHLPQC